jgi:branched-chain amino acid transport system permease protein
MNQFWQHLADGVLSGAIIALGAIGVALSLSILRFANFAHGELLTVGAYMALLCVAFIGVGEPIGELSFGWGLVVAVIPAGVLTAALALLTDRLIYRRLRRRNAARLTLIFASFGVSLILRNAIHLAFSGEPEYFTRELTIAVRVLGVRVMPDQFVVLGASFVIVAALHLFLKYATLGLTMRATAESPELARVNGIDVDRVVAWTWALAAALAAMAGVFLGLTVQLRPEMGFNVLLSLFAAAILGGAGSMIGAVVGGILVGVAENLSVMVISSGYRQAVPFVLLVAMLYFRPHGLFGERS